MSKRDYSLPILFAICAAGVSVVLAAQLAPEAFAETKSGHRDITHLYSLPDNMKDCKVIQLDPDRSQDTYASSLIVVKCDDGSKVDTTSQNGKFVVRASVK